MREYIVKAKSIEGKRNIENGSGNQDSVKIYENEEYLIVCANDGCTSCDYPKKACEINSEVAVNIGTEPAIFEIQEKKFKQLILNEYKERFDEANVPIEELSATTAFVVINKLTKQFIAFSVGDTAILSYNSDLRLSMLLAPKNGIIKSVTNFTNDNTAVKKYSQFKRGMIGDKFAGFIIYTDGAENISLNTNESSNQANRLLRACYTSDEEYTREEMKVFNSLKKLTSDDITIAIIASVNDNITNKLKAVKQPYAEPESVHAENNYDIFEDKDDCIIYEPVHEKSGDTRSFNIASKSKSIPHNNDILYESNAIVGENTESSLLRFMKSARSVDEIVCSGIINEKEVVPTLTLLFRIGAISCVNNKFKTR